MVFLTHTHPISLVVRLAALVATAIVGTAPPVSAQDVPPENLPIGRYVADTRFTFPKVKQDAATAHAISVPPLNLPTRALGFVIGAHWYPMRLGIVTFGLGGEITAAGRGHTLNTGTDAAPLNVTVNSRFATISPQVSFNFGARDGWSYISGGIGSSTFT